MRALLFAIRLMMTQLWRALGFAAVGACIGMLVGISGALLLALLGCLLDYIQEGSFGARWTEPFVQLFGVFIAATLLSSVSGALAFGVLGAFSRSPRDGGDPVYYRALNGAWRGALPGALCGFTFPIVVTMSLNITGNEAWISFWKNFNGPAGSMQSSWHWGGYIFGLVLGTLFAGFGNSENWLAAPTRVLFDRLKRKLRN